MVRDHVSLMALFFLFGLFFNISQGVSFINLEELSSLIFYLLFNFYIFQMLIFNLS